MVPEPVRCCVTWEKFSSSLVEQFCLCNTSTNQPRQHFSAAIEPAPQLRCFGSPVPLVGDAEIGGSEVLEGDRHAVTSLPYFLYLGFCCVSVAAPATFSNYSRGCLVRDRQGLELVRVVAFMCSLIHKW